MKALTATSSKAEEIETFEQFRVIAGKDSYLSLLLSEKLFQWFCDEIRVDNCPDIYQWYVGSGQAITKLNNDLADAQRTIASRDEMLLKVQAELRQVIASRDDWESETHSLRIHTAAQREEIDHLREQIREMKIKLYDMAVAAGRL